MNNTDKRIETVVLPAWLTWEQFGCKTPNYFFTYIRNKPLIVRGRFLHIVQLQDRNGEHWQVHENDLIHDKRAADDLNYPWRDEMPSQQISQENKRLVVELRAAVVEKSITKNRLRIHLIQLCQHAHDKGELTRAELEWWRAYTRLAFEEDLKASIQIVQDLNNRTTHKQAA